MCIFSYTCIYEYIYNITNWPVRGSTRYSLFIINKWPIIKFIAGMPPESGGCGGGLVPRMAFDEKLMRARAFVRKGPAVIYWLRDYYSYMLHSTPPHARRQYKIYNGCRNILFFNLMGRRRVASCVSECLVTYKFLYSIYVKAFVVRVDCKSPHAPT